MARKSSKNTGRRTVKSEPAMSALEAEMAMLEDERYADGIDMVGMQYA